MELAAYIYDAWAYEQANQGTTDRNLPTYDGLDADEHQSNKLDWNFAAMKQQAYLLSAIAFTSLSGLSWNLAPAMAAHMLEPSVNVAPWCNQLYLCNTSYMLEVQTLLAQRGFAVGEVDGVYGRYTKQAVIDFQKTQTNLVADGIPGEKTLALLRNTPVGQPISSQQPNQTMGQPTGKISPTPLPNQTIVLRPNTPQVSNPQQQVISEIGNLQILLKQRGFYQGEIDGQLGQTTTNAILKAQQAYGLTKDGFVGPLTMRSLLAGGNNLPLTQPALPRLPTKPNVLQIQELLKERGFYSGELSGLYNTLTKESISNAQLAYGLKATGEISTELITALRAQDMAQQSNVQDIQSNQDIRSSPNNPSTNNIQVNIQANYLPRNFSQAPFSSQNAPSQPPSSPSL
jgi:peptidoglycan hydrolase-like protein with peptidoglycan-binding domain